MKLSLKKIDVNNVFAEGQVFKTPFFVIRWRLAEQGASQIGFVFARHCGSSVERHTFKRRFRELLRTHVNPSILHLVIAPRKKLSLISRQDWQNEKQRFLGFLQKI